MKVESYNFEFVSLCHIIVTTEKASRTQIDINWEKVIIPGISGNIFVIRTVIIGNLRSQKWEYNKIMQLTICHNLPASYSGKPVVNHQFGKPNCW